jgi:hypothetical protein
MELERDKMSEALKYNRRRFLGFAAVTIAAAKVVGVDFAYAQSSNTKAADLTTTKP